MTNQNQKFNVKLKAGKGKTVLERKLINCDQN
jgi:hypothetical protein